MELECSRNNTTSITVSDSGPGVPDKDLPHLFEPFYRVAEARDRGTGGTGLGLAITDRTVRLHGGAVEAFNRPKGGLSISISFPQGRGANSIAESGAAVASVANGLVSVARRLGLQYAEDLDSLPRVAGFRAFQTPSYC